MGNVFGGGCAGVGHAHTAMKTGQQPGLGHALNVTPNGLQRDTQCVSQLFDRGRALRINTFKKFQLARISVHRQQLQILLFSKPLHFISEKKEKNKGKL